MAKVSLSPSGIKRYDLRTDDGYLLCVGRKDDMERVANYINYRLKQVAEQVTRERDELKAQGKMDEDFIRQKGKEFKKLEQKLARSKYHIERAKLVADKHMGSDNLISIHLNKVLEEIRGK